MCKSTRVRKLQSICGSRLWSKTALCLGCAKVFDKNLIDLDTLSNRKTQLEAEACRSEDVEGNSAHYRALLNDEEAAQHALTICKEDISRIELECESVRKKDRPTKRRTTLLNNPKYSDAFYLHCDRSKRACHLKVPD